MIITVAQYKALTGRTTSEDDVQIGAIINAVESDFLRIRGKAFDTDDNDQVIYPEGSMMAAAEMVGYKLLTLRGNVGSSYEMIGNYSISLTTDLLCGYPRSTVQKIKRYARWQ